jgi:hypothetical protein
MAVLRTIHTGLTVHDLEQMKGFFVDCLGAQAGETRQIPTGETLATWVNRLSAAKRATNILAARIGPTVCELLGPMPILKRSKREMAISRLRACSKAEKVSVQGLVDGQVSRSSGPLPGLSDGSSTPGNRRHCRPDR